MKLYVANYGLMLDLEVEWDDPSVKDMSLEDFACPQYASVSTRDSIEWLSRIRKAIDDELKEMYDPEDLPKGLHWIIGQWQTPKVGRRNIVHQLVDPEGRLEAVVVIQEVEEGEA